MKLKIIFPKRENDWFSKAVGKLAMPVAPTYLAALTPQDIDSTITDMMAGDIIDYDDPVDLIAITVRTPAAVQAYKIADEYRNRTVAVVLGGPHVSVLPLEAKRHADAVVIGEAEEIWEKLLQDFRAGILKDFYVGGPFETLNLPGETYHVRTRTSFIGLPHLRRDLLPRKRYRMDSIFTSRGCPHRCSYCDVPVLFGSKFRHRPIEEVIAEVETLPGGYNNIDDSVFGAAHDHQYYLDLYRELAKLPKKRFWLGEGALGVVEFNKGKEILKHAADSGLFRLVMGIESVHGPGLGQAGAGEKLGFNHMGDFSLEKIKRAVRIIQDYGIDIFGFFIVGFDRDTADTFRKTLEFCQQTKIIPMINILSPLPGTPLYKQFESERRFQPDLNWDTFMTDELVFKHPSMTGGEIKRAKDEAMNTLYNLLPIVQRVSHAFKRRPHPAVLFSSLFMQLGIRQSVTKH
jgi:radical SAM superfamily enzyme YgiQ (UPF0313 family)